MRTDAYELLGVGRDAAAGEIKTAFRRLARELHPDVNDHDPEAEDRFKEVAEAYEILSDPERRSLYDRYGYEGVRSSGFHSTVEGFGSFADIFDAFFGGDPFGFGRRAGGAIHGGDVVVAADIDLAQAAAGTSVDVSYEAVGVCESCGGDGAAPGSRAETCERCGGSGERRSISRTAFGQLVRSHPCDACGGRGEVVTDPCSECRGRGRVAHTVELTVDIPAGIGDEQRIRLSGRGHAGERGGPPGDLYVVVRVRPHPDLLRDGDDLYCALDVPAPLAALGTTLAVPTIDGEEEVEVPAGTQPGHVITLRGRGMPSLRGRGRGDQRVVVNVIVPRRLNAEQRDLLERFSETLDGRNLGDEREPLVEKLRRVLR